MKSIINRLDWIIASTLQLLSFMKHERAQTKNCSKLIDTFNVARPLRSAKCLLWNEIYTHIGTSHIQKHIMIFEKSQTKWWEQKKSLIFTTPWTNNEITCFFLNLIWMWNATTTDDARIQSDIIWQIDWMKWQNRYDLLEMKCRVRNDKYLNISASVLTVSRDSIQQPTVI